MLKLFLIMLLTIVWTASRAQEITMDFTDNSGWNIPDKDKTTNKPQTLAMAIMLLRYRVIIIMLVQALI